jgi:hypothetical protein
MEANIIRQYDHNKVVEGYGVLAKKRQSFPSGIPLSLCGYAICFLSD